MKSATLLLVALACVSCSSSSPSGVANVPANTAAPTVAKSPTTPPTPGENCDAAYPTVCIPPPPPDLDCKDVTARGFKVLPPDPHKFDNDGNGIGCEGQ
mgnify:CR=1 FL=1